jgi:hypothetical protein
MKRFLCACAVVAAAGFAACGGSSSTPDAGGGGGFGAKCTTVSDTSTECTSGVCTDSFNMLGYDVCSQTCQMKMMMDSSCPVGSGGSAFCNGKGYCKP